MPRTSRFFTGFGLRALRDLADSQVTFDEFVDYVYDRQLQPKKELSFWETLSCDSVIIGAR